MKTLRNAIGIVLALAVGAAAQARPTGGVPGKQIGTPTRQVTIFTQLERQLLEAQKDKTLLDAMLTDDFAEHHAEQPEDVVDRQAAMQRGQGAPMQGSFRNMDVRMEGDTAIVSFVFLHRAEKQAGAKRSNATYIVDIWRKQGETYQLSARYAAPIRIETPRDVRPTGKD